MKLLKDILYKVGLVEIIGSTNLTISSINFDSRKTSQNSLFIAIKGTTSDGHIHIEATIKSCAIAILC